MRRIMRSNTIKTITPKLDGKDVIAEATLLRSQRCDILANLFTPNDGPSAIMRCQPMPHPKQALEKLNGGRHAYQSLDPRGLPTLRGSSPQQPLTVSACQIAVKPSWPRELL